jgi:hypothetical protein
MSARRFDLRSTRPSSRVERPAKVHPGRLTFFASIDNLEWQRQCWTPLVQGGLTVVEVPARHDEMCARYSKLLAEKIDDCLERR